MSVVARSTIKLAPYRILPDKEHYIVELLETGDFYEMPKPAVEAIEALVQGTSPDQIELSLKSKYPDEEINMKTFLVQLGEMGFLVDGEAASQEAHIEQILGGELSFISKSAIGRFLFCNQLIPVYAILFCANMVFFIVHPNLFPQPHDLFPFDSMMLNMIASFVVSIVLLAIHESGHAMAARASDLKSSIRISHRFFLPVFETQMPTIWRLPRGRRNVPLLAGLFMDHTLLFLSLAVLVFASELSATVAGILGLIVLQLLLMSLYQCMFFMKTDLYYLLQNVTGSYNLLENAEEWLKDKVPFKRNSSTSVIYEKERNIVRAYAIFYLIGLIFSAVIFIFYVIPQLKYSFAISFDRFIHPSSISMKADAILFFAQFIIYAGILMYSWSRKFTPKR